MNIAIALLATALTLPSTGFAQDNDWPGTPWETATCPGANLEYIEFKSYGRWDSENRVFIENGSHEIWSGPGNSPNLHVRWIGGDVEILCGEKFAFIGTNHMIVIEIATPMQNSED